LYQSQGLVAINKGGIVAGYKNYLVAEAR